MFFTKNEDGKKKNRKKIGNGGGDLDRRGFENQCWVVPGRELRPSEGRKCGELRWRWEVVVKWKMTKKRGKKTALF